MLTPKVNLSNGREQRACIAHGQRGLRRLLRSGEPIFPFVFTDPVTLTLQKQMKDVEMDQAFG